MSTTSVRNIVATGLAALALMACNYPGPPNVDPGGASTGGGEGGSGGAGGQGGGVVEVIEVEMFKCDDYTPEYVINGTVYGQSGMVVFDYEYIPKELTMHVGGVVKFIPFTSTQNMTSGYASPSGQGDGKFYTPQGGVRCLKFNVAGTYPFFDRASVVNSDEMIGVIYVLE